MSASQTCRVSECVFGNALTDMFLWVGEELQEVDIAFGNGGSIRAVRTNLPLNTQAHIRIQTHTLTASLLTSFVCAAGDRQRVSGCDSDGAAIPEHGGDHEPQRLHHSAHSRERRQPHQPRWHYCWYVYVPVYLWLFSYVCVCALCTVVLVLFFVFFTERRMRPPGQSGTGRFLQTAGLRYTFNPRYEVGSRVHDINVRKYDPTYNFTFSYYFASQ